MDKKKFEKILKEHKQKMISAIIILLVIVGFIIIYINVKENSSSESIDPRANVYAGEDFRYFQETLDEDVDKDNKDRDYSYHDHDDYSYCDYSDYKCSHDDYECYFDRKRECNKKEREFEDNAKIIYILNERDEDRYLIREYEYGYTYRATDDYIKRHGEKIIIEYKTIIIGEDYYDGEGDKKGGRALALSKGNNGEYYYYEYNSFKKENLKKVCYKEAPVDKLFYNKCPVF